MSIKNSLFLLSLFVGICGARLDTASANIMSCADLMSFSAFRKSYQPKPAEVKSPKDKLFIEKLVEKKLKEYGFKPSDNTTAELHASRRSKALAQKIDSYQLQSTSYRNAIIEKIIDLKISENLDPLDNYELTLKPAHRKALTRIILRSLIEEGLQELPTSEEPNLFARTLKIARMVVNSRAFKAVTKLQFPKRRYTLSDMQLTWLANEGVNYLVNSSEVQSLVKAEARTAFLKKANKVASVGVVLFMIAHFSFYQVPQIEKVAETTIEAQAQQNTEGFISNTNSQLDTAQAKPLLNSAMTEVSIIETEFKNRYKQAPSAEEARMIRESVCNDAYGDFLSAEEVTSCLSS